MICQFLQELGYSVLEAKDGGDAVALAEQYKGTIDVLLDRCRHAAYPRFRSGASPFGLASRI